MLPGSDKQTETYIAGEHFPLKIQLGGGTGDETNRICSLSSEIKSLDLSKVVKARIEEIVANVNAHFEYAKCDRKSLGAGMVIVGGASKLSDLPELIA